MKKSLLTVTLGLAALAVALGGFCFVTGNCQAKSKFTSAGNTAKAPAGKQPTAPREIYWFTALDQAQKASKSSGKPIFVDFYATWCPPCKMLETQTYPDPQVIAESQKWIMVKIDTDKQTDVATRYGITSLPTLGVIKSDGKPVVATSGFVSADELIQFMRDAQTKK